MRAVERTQDVHYFSSFFANSWLNCLENIGQDQRSLCTTHPLILVIIGAYYGKRSSRTVAVTERTPNAGRTDGLKPISSPPPCFAEGKIK